MSSRSDGTSEGYTGEGYEPGPPDPFKFDHQTAELLVARVSKALGILAPYARDIDEFIATLRAWADPHARMREALANRPAAKPPAQHRTIAQATHEAYWEKRRMYGRVDPFTDSFLWSRLDEQEVMMWEVAASAAVTFACESIVAEAVETGVHSKGHRTVAEAAHAAYSASLGTFEPYRWAELSEQEVLAWEMAAGAAIDFVQGVERIPLAAKDSAAFAQALLEPPKPNEKLREARAKHTELVVPATCECPHTGVAGVHSKDFLEGEGPCAWCGAKPVPAARSSELPEQRVSIEERDRAEAPSPPGGGVEASLEPGDATAQPAGAQRAEPGAPCSYKGPAGPCTRERGHEGPCRFAAALDSSA